MINRRHFLVLLGLFGLAAVGLRYWPRQGWWNPCLEGPIPAALLQHELLQAAWQGIDPNQVWDSHVHIAGVGDGASGIHIDPDMRSPLHPIQYAQFQFYLDAACVDDVDSIDAAYVARLLHLQRGFQPRSRLMLLALDYRHDQAGRAQPQQSQLYVPNEYAAALHRRHPEAFEWIASVHPYREDCVEALAWAAAHGARAVKWLPSLMAIDPASKRCDAFYAALRRHNLPLLTHAGSEYALDVFGSQRFNHPLLLRYPLEQGVTVIVAHCASLGSAPDLDKSPHAPARHNMEFFARLMAEQDYEGLLYGDIAAITTVNRSLDVIQTLFTREQWQHRLINGSDYPIPGVMPLYALERYVAAGVLSREAARLLTEIRRYNVLLFDFLLKRSLCFDGARLGAQVFETRRLFSV